MGVQRLMRAAQTQPGERELRIETDRALQVRQRLRGASQGRQRVAHPEDGRRRLGW